jgi:SNF family Na+-dependent transporter
MPLIVIALVLLVVYMLFVPLVNGGLPVIVTVDADAVDADGV